MSYIGNYVYSGDLLKDQQTVPTVSWLKGRVSLTSCQNVWKCYVKKKVY